MKNRYLLLSLLVMLAALGFTAWLYPGLPARIPRLLASGGADPLQARSILFWHTGVMLLLMLSWCVLARISPRQHAIDAFAPTYWYGMLTVVALLAYIQCLHAWSAHTGKLDMARAVLTGFALFSALLGNVMGKVRRNFWLGVRTPWTLASDRVWYATHRLAARSMVTAAALALLLLLAHASPHLVAATLIAGALLPAIWSLVYYKRLERRGALGA